MKGNSPAVKYLRSALLTSSSLAVASIAFVSSLMHFHIHTIFIGLIWGSVVGFSGTAMEQFFFNKRGQRWSFSALLGARTMFYFLLVGGCIFWIVGMHEQWMTGCTFSESFQHSNIRDYFTGGDFTKDLLFGLLLMVFINFARQISRIMGGNVFRSYIFGKYHRPVTEKRIIMFLDLNDSTTIAEKLGAEKYHRFINETFFRVTPAIIANKGEIYQYVGDEMVITWREKPGIMHEHCVRCFFDIRKLLTDGAPKFEVGYGYIPSFKAGIHLGHVVVGEIGDVKREIAFLGDTINTAARIRSACSVLKRSLLVSAELIGALNDTRHLMIEKMGPMRLKGKEEKMELCAITVQEGRG